jgi:hypothetical protein
MTMVKADISAFMDRLTNVTLVSSLEVILDGVYLT